METFWYRLIQVHLAKRPLKRRQREREVYISYCFDSPRETLTLKAGQYKYTGTMPLNIPSSPDPFPLGLHALPLGLLDRASTQAGPTS